MSKVHIRLNSVFLTITYKCNQRCVFCYASENIKKVNRHAPLSKIQRYVDILAEILPPRSAVHITGGEPTTHSHCTEIIKYIKETTDLNANLITNGVLLSNIGFLDEIIASGVDSIQISIEGVQKIHEKITQTKGSWDLCVKGVKNILRFYPDVRFSTNTTLSAINKDSIEDLIVYLAELGVKNVNVNGIVQDIWSKNLKYLLKYQEIVDIVEKLTVLADILDVNLRYLMPLPRCLTENRKLEVNSVCSACRTMITIDIDGSVIPCPQFSEERFKLGNILEDDFLGMWNKQPAIYLRNMEYLPDECRECKLVQICRGACPLYWITNREKFFNQKSSTELLIY